jgi:hypothetical protein
LSPVGGTHVWAWQRGLSCGQRQMITNGSDDVIVGKDGTAGRRQLLLCGTVEYHSSSIVFLQVYLSWPVRSILAYLSSRGWPCAPGGYRLRGAEWPCRAEEGQFSAQAERVLPLDAPEGQKRGAPPAQIRLRHPQAGQGAV